jgi:ubiquinone/menaquinone biosynthesis C-methylase UbiE
MGYTALAPYYDRIMTHVNYDQWVRLINRICDKYQKTSPVDILEIGAGTGSLAQKLLQQSYSFTGSDISYHMCQQARKRNLSFCCADGRHLPFKKQFDMALFLYDGINYLFTEKDYSDLFVDVHRALKPHGLFLFDITTQANSTSYFLDHHECEDFGDCYCFRHSYFDRIHSIQYNDFTLFVKDGDQDGSYKKYSDTHSQKVLPVAIVKRWIPKSLFSLVGVWDGFSLSPANKRSERIHFLLKRI